MNETKTLAEKIASASILVGAFQADKKNLDQKYEYISADAVLSRGGDALAKAGVSVIPEIDNIMVAPVERQGKAPRIDATTFMCMTVTDGKETYSVKWVGMGSDYSTPDKALYKAITSGHKYFLMKLLNIGVGNEDGEHEDEPKAEPNFKGKKEYPPESRQVDDEENEPTTFDYSSLPDAVQQVRNSSGLLYTEISSYNLQNMLLGISKAVKANSHPEKAEEYAFKSDAIKAIIKLRQDQGVGA